MGKKYKGVDNLSLEDENKVIKEIERLEKGYKNKRDVITDFPFKKNEGDKKKKKKKSLDKLKIPSKNPEKLERRNYYKLKKMTPKREEIEKRKKRDLDRNFKPRVFA